MLLDISKRTLSFPSYRCFSERKSKHFIRSCLGRHKQTAPRIFNMKQTKSTTHCSNYHMTGRFHFPKTSFSKCKCRKKHSLLEKTWAIKTNNYLAKNLSWSKLENPKLFNIFSKCRCPSCNIPFHIYFMYSFPYLL